MEVPADPAAGGSQCPLRRGPLLALHLPSLPAAQREGDRAGGAATGHGVEEEPDGGQAFQVPLPSWLLPARVLSSRCAEDRVTSEDRLTEASLSSSLSFPFLTWRLEAGALTTLYLKKDADTCFALAKSLYAFLPKPDLQSTIW